MRKLLVAAALSLLSLTACKKPQPSQAYADASAKFASIYGQKLDEAYADPQMDGILQQLSQVPADSLDAKSAADLKTRIENGRAQLQKEKQDRAAAGQAALAPQTMQHFEPRTETQRPAAQGATGEDAGMNLAMAPRPGMSAADFEKSFGSCFEFGPTIQLGGASTGPADSRTLRDDSQCRSRLPGYESKMVLFQNGVVVNVADKAAIKTVTRVVDGGIVNGGH